MKSISWFWSIGCDGRVYFPYSCELCFLSTTPFFESDFVIGKSSSEFFFVFFFSFVVYIGTQQKTKWVSFEWYGSLIRRAEMFGDAFSVLRVWNFHVWYQEGWGDLWTNFLWCIIHRGFDNLKFSIFISTFHICCVWLGENLIGLNRYSVYSQRP